MIGPMFTLGPPPVVASRQRPLSPILVIDLYMVMASPLTATSLPSTVTTTASPGRQDTSASGTVSGQRSPKSLPFSSCDLGSVGAAGELGACDDDAPGVAIEGVRGVLGMLAIMAK